MHYTKRVDNKLLDRLNFEAAEEEAKQRSKSRVSSSVRRRGSASAVMTIYICAEKPPPLVLYSYSRASGGQQSRGGALDFLFVAERSYHPTSATPPLQPAAICRGVGDTPPPMIDTSSGLIFSSPNFFTDFFLFFFFLF